jgi:hypothetical protein
MKGNGLLLFLNLLLPRFLCQYWHSQILLPQIRYEMFLLLEFDCPLLFLLLLLLRFLKSYLL